MNETLALGIDIGTTTISAAVISFSQKSLVESFNIAGGGFAHSDVSGAKEQNAKEISEKISSLFMMTPYAYRTPKQSAEKLLEMTELSCEAEFIILVYERI